MKLGRGYNTPHCPPQAKTSRINAFGIGKCKREIVNWKITWDLEIWIFFGFGII